MQKRRAAKEEEAEKKTVAADQDAGKDKGGRKSPIGRFRSPFGRRNVGSPEPERKQEAPDKVPKAGGRFWSPQRKREEPQQPAKVPAAPQLPPVRVPPAAPVAQQAKQAPVPAPAPVKIASPPPKQAQQQQPPPPQQRQPPAMQQQQLRAVQAQQRAPPGREDSFSASDFTDEEDYESETASDDSPPIRRR